MQKNKIIEFFIWLINLINPFLRITKLLRMLDDPDIKTMSLSVWLWATLILYSGITLWLSSIILNIYVYWSLPDITDIRLLPIFVFTIFYLNKHIDKL